MVRELFVASLAALAVNVASAQSLNLDAQDWAGDPASLPPGSYGGPALSPGAWNNIHQTLTQGGLVTVDGAPTGAWVEMTIGCPNSPHACDDPNTSSPHELLLDDYQMCDGSDTEWLIQGLANGQYEIYTIVFRPCSGVVARSVGVFGSPEGEQPVAATWNGSFVQGQNYTRHTKVVTDGTISLYVYTPGSGILAPLCGVQLVQVDALPAAGVPQCFGDNGAACPCANAGASGSGCQNSAGSGGGRLYTTGTTSPDTVVLNSYRELPSALSIFLQGNATVGPLVFGDGLRCAGGILKRLYVKNASSGVVTAPAGGDPSITARSAALGDPIPAGERRYYQVYYRDANAGFCPPPQGSTFNATHAVKIVW